MPAPSLFELATNAAIKNVKSIDDIGDTPLRLVRPILSYINSPEQLKTLEINSPQVRGEVNEVWEALCRKYVLGYRSHPVKPKDPRKWYKFYQKLVEETDANAKKSADALKAALQSKDAEKQANKMTFMTNVAHTPPHKRRKVMEHRGSNISSSSTGKPKSGLDLLDKAKRQAQENSVFRVGKQIAPRNTTSHSSSTSTQPSKPPAGGISTRVFTSNQRRRP